MWILWLILFSFVCFWTFREVKCVGDSLARLSHSPRFWDSSVLPRAAVLSLPWAVLFHFMAVAQFIFPFYFWQTSACLLLSSVVNTGPVTILCLSPGVCLEAELPGHSGAESPFCPVFSLTRVDLQYHTVVVVCISYITSDTEHVFFQTVICKLLVW